MDLPTLSFHASLKEQWDEEEEAEGIDTVLKVVPPAYHQYLDKFSQVQAEKLPPHRACYHHSKLEGLLHPVIVIYSLSNISQKHYRPIFQRMENRYPVPPMNQLLTVFNNSAIFSKIDWWGAENLLKIKEGDEQLIAFRTKYGSYEYLVMPFGLTNVASSFQNLVKDNNLFSKASRVYSMPQAWNNRAIFSSEGLKMDYSKVQQILNWPQPKNIKALQSFLGFANFHCCFIINYSKKIPALTSLLKKDFPFIFNEEVLSQFHIIKEAFTTSPILSHFNPSLPTILETYASDYALGAVPSRVNDSGKHPIAFDSGKLLPAELNYEIHDEELLGIVWALMRWRAFLLSLYDSFEVLKDHYFLHYFMSSKVLTCCQARWAEILSELHFSITYCPGRLATLPEALSCLDDVYPERGWTSLERILKIEL
ncbi:hypothetical protein O181_021836 [Austropuccinia psidii MF-1]|uniref:Reverse transcriptase/retrotransposon-derived protein RNase H-like domain-containing protein n=1 Tax=Austropuccinia psidii MF-1 TaxID=1389203 RepID=A0A9Q3CG85_9BASI|nr:hypothetical protein [Austropuccinia psidii MF-1]